MSKKCSFVNTRAQFEPLKGVQAIYDPQNRRKTAKIAVFCDLGAAGMVIFGYLSRLRRDKYQKNTKCQMNLTLRSSPFDQNLERVSKTGVWHFSPPLEGQKCLQMTFVIWQTTTLDRLEPGQLPVREVDFTPGADIGRTAVKFCQNRRPV